MRVIAEICDYILYVDLVKKSLYSMTFVAVLLVSPALAAAEPSSVDEESGVSLSLTTDFAWYPKYDFKPGDDHFSGVSGPFDGIKGITRLDASYALPTPLGRHWLVNGANVEFTGGFEICPVSVRTIASIGFTPVPFWVFETGASVGTGWTLLGLEGMSNYDFEKGEYKDITPFAHYYRDFWVSGTFQFDTGALIEGDWSHVVMMVTYELLFAGLTGIDDGDVWQWQTTKNKANGWQYDLVGVLGYKMPLVLSMVGVMADFYGHFDSSDYGKIGKRFDGDFMTVDLCLLLTFDLNKTNSLTVMIEFERNRSFETEHEEYEEEPLLKASGAEWAFYMVALRWMHNF